MKRYIHGVDRHWTLKPQKVEPEFTELQMFMLKMCDAITVILFMVFIFACMFSIIFFLTGCSTLGDSPQFQ